MMAVLSQNPKSTKQFLVHLLCLDMDGPAPLMMEMLTGDIISWLNEMVHDREEQLRELPKYKHEFQHIAAEVSGADTLAGLEVCHACACG